MAVNEYMTPAEYTPGVSYVSQYIPLPFEDMMKQVEKKQTAYDTGLTNTQKQIFNAAGIGKKNIYGQDYMFKDDQLVKERVSEYDKRKAELLREGTEKGTWNQAAINQLATDYAVDPVIKAATQRKKDIEAMEAAIAKEKVTGGNKYRINQYQDKLKELYQTGLYDETGAIATVGDVPIMEDIDPTDELNKLSVNLGSQGAYKDLNKFIGMNQAGEYVFMDDKRTGNRTALNAAKNNIFNPSTNLGRLTREQATLKTTEQMLAANPDYTLAELRQTKEYQDAYNKNLEQEQLRFIKESEKFLKADQDVNIRTARDIAKEAKEQSSYVKELEDGTNVLVSEEVFAYGNPEEFENKSLQEMYDNSKLSVAQAKQDINNPKLSGNQKNNAKLSLMKHQATMENLLSKLSILGETNPVARSLYNKMKSQYSNTYAMGVGKGYGAINTVTSNVESNLTPEEKSLLGSTKFETSQITTNSITNSTGSKELDKAFNDYGSNNKSNLLFFNGSLEPQEIGSSKIKFAGYGSKPLSVPTSDGKFINANPIKYEVYDEDDKPTGTYVFAVPANKEINNHLRKTVGKQLTKKERDDLGNSVIGDMYLGTVYDSMNEFLTNPKGQPLAPNALNDKTLVIEDKSFKFKQKGKTAQGLTYYDVLDSSGKSILPKGEVLDESEIKGGVGAAVLYQAVTGVNPAKLDNFKLAYDQVFTGRTDYYSPETVALNK